MKKVIGIYYEESFNEDSFKNGCGGSETWCIQIAKQFTIKGYHTIIFCNTNWHFSESGIEYVPIDLFEFRCQYQHFDYFIMVRAFNDNVYNTISHTGCKNIYLQSHDMFVWDNVIYDKKFIMNDPYGGFKNLFPNFKKFIALTEFHKEELVKYNHIPEDMIEVIGNGLDSDILDSIEYNYDQRDYSILFSTVYSRGGDILVNHIAPLVRKEIPNFEVYLCGYAKNYNDDIVDIPYVHILGMLSKEEYYKEFMKHRCWFLPCVVPEDFGICAPEAVLCGCDIVSPFIHGMKDVLWPFTNIGMHNKFITFASNEYHYSQYQLDMTDIMFERTCQEAANRIIDSIKNYYNEDKIFLRQSMKNFVKRTYTWKAIVDKWESMFMH